MDKSLYSKKSLHGSGWFEISDKVLRRCYGTLSIKELEEILPGRTGRAIKARARRLGLSHHTEENSKKKGSLLPLLDITPEAYYWMGFIMADGHLRNNGVLKLTLSYKDEDQVRKFANFINCPNIGCCCEGMGFGVKLMDKYNLPKIIDKFRIKFPKTTNPSDISWMEGDLFLSFFIGYVDGDGCISKRLRSAGCCLIFRVHSGWLPALQEMSNKLHKLLNLPPRIAKINKSGYADLTIGKQLVLVFLRDAARRLNLPYLSRKWDKIPNEEEIRKGGVRV